ncbi:MAG: hypothetical protein KatS3mg109_0516 [Pirellulaceae bacterium]|nr:MAG: hypothetical protein KatS3mg109_0516 [Pirellulaceae bacterium]GIW94223.1 MAG: hypothetical protein KatS3mg110_2264 [Pirellulaceae bacterium]
MNSLTLLEETFRIARRLGYGIRQEWIGSGGGLCEVRGRRWIFVDLSQSVSEQLAMMAQILGRDPRIDQVTMSEALRSYLHSRRAA